MNLTDRASAAYGPRTSDVPRRRGRPLSRALALVALGAAVLLTLLGVGATAVAADSTKVAACGTVNLRARPSASSALDGSLVNGARVQVVDTVVGSAWRVRCSGQLIWGRGWYKISAVDGRSVSSLYGVRYVYGARGLFRSLPTTKAAACATRLRTRANMDATTKVRLDPGDTVTVVGTIPASRWSRTCAGSPISGRSWFRVTRVGDRSVSAAYGVPYLYAPEGTLRTPTATPAPTPTPTPTPTPSATTAPLASNAFYVSTSGSDAASGSSSSPWQTLQKAANTVPAGATVYVRSGTYTGFTMTRSGTSSAPISFVAYPGDSRPVITGNGRLDTIKVSAAHDIVIDGFLINGAAGGGGSGAGVRTENSAYRITIRNNVIRDNRSYGVNVNNSSSVIVSDNEVAWNEEGIYVSHGGAGVRIVGNRVHDQNKMVVNTPTSVNAHDDHGAVGIVFVKTTGSIVASGNQIWANRAPSYDYGWDGGAFEIYGASNVTMEHNTTWNNENVFETGTDSGVPCDNNIFRRNTSYGATTTGRSFGVFLRCATNMIVAQNVFHNLDGFVFSVSNGGSMYAGAIDGLRIQNNIAVMASGKVFGIESSLPSSVVIDNNVVDNTSGGYIASVSGRGSTSSLATFTSWTGYMAHGVDADPRFVNAAGHDYHVGSGSPAIDRGVVVFSNESWNGAAPDAGRYETP